MRYLYYIIGILVLFSIWALYTLSSSKIEVSKPALVINDRVIAHSELKKMLEDHSYRGSEQQNIDQLITRQILIQEAVHQKINQEESFRRAVQNYYEQSLVKILMDRQEKKAKVNISPEEVERYKSFAKNRVVILSRVYENEEAARQGQAAFEEEKIVSDFVDLPDYLRFLVISLGRGGISEPFLFETGVWVYHIEDIEPLDEESSDWLSDEEIIRFLGDHKKQEALDAWIQHLKEKATIWRKDES